MKQLKIIDKRGQCRGRPPTKGCNRDGPGEQASRQLAVDSWQIDVSDQRLAVIGREPGTLCLLSSVVKRRWGDVWPRGPGTKWKLAGNSRQPGILYTEPETPENLVLQHHSFGFGGIDPEIKHRRTVFLISLARDWPNLTCSVSPRIRQNRNNDSMLPILHLPKNSETGEYCPVVNLRIVNNADECFRQIYGLSDYA